MALTFGSLRHTSSGRKRKPLPKSKRYTPKFQPLEETTTYRRETPQYKSCDQGGHNTELVEKPKLAISIGRVGVDKATATLWCQPPGFRAKVFVLLFVKLVPDTATVITL